MSVQPKGPFEAGPSGAAQGGKGDAVRRTILNPVSALAAGRALAAGDKARDEKRWSEAVEAYGKYVRLKPESADIWVQYAHCLKESGAVENAEKAYLEALALEPDNPDTLLHIGRIKRSSGDSASALALLERAAAGSPDPGAGDGLRSDASREILGLGDGARDESRWAEAAAAYEAYLRLTPEAADIWVQLGHCLKESGRPDEAEKAYFRNLEFNPGNSDVLLHLGRLRLSAGDLASAAYYLELAAEAPSPSADASADLRGLVLSRFADFSASEAGDETGWLDDLLEHAPSFGSGKEGAEFWSRLGEFLEEKPDQAERAYRQAIELDPDNPETRDRLGRLTRSIADAASVAAFVKRVEAAASPPPDASDEPLRPWAQERDESQDLRDRTRERSGDKGILACEPNVLEWLAAELARPTNATSQPSALATAIGLRDLANLRANSKMMAAYIAELTYSSRIAATPLRAPGRIETKGRVCKQRDFSSDWFLYWMQRLRLAPRLHRKLWEDAYVTQCLWERGCLERGKKGLGFAVGREALPSLFVSSGARITATDLSPDDQRSRVWEITNQHASNIEALWRPDLVEKQVFRENCSFELVDMDAIPSKFDGQFDFCWSICAFEHLGALRAGLEFVREATRVLKPGGVAVHTTEYNISDGETIDNWSTVLYQKKDFATLGEMIRDAGCKLVEIDFDPGNEFFDCYVDVPPYSNDQSNGLTLPEPPHVKLSVDGFPATSIAIIVEKDAG